MKAIDLLPSLERMALKYDKPVPTLAMVEAILKTFDETELTAEWRLRIETKMWDGVSDINSANEAYIRESNPWCDVVYVLLIDGKVVYMQTHDPFQDGHVPITNETVDALSNAHADLIAKNNTESEIYDQLIIQLGLVNETLPE